MSSPENKYLIVSGSVINAVFDNIKGAENFAGRRAKAQPGKTYAIYELKTNVRATRVEPILYWDVD